ncbi:hypothetical protein AAKU55_003191 [Oxalobacteraceae bacterium GrIS 1.11]
MTLRPLAILALALALTPTLVGAVRAAPASDLPKDYAYSLPLSVSGSAGVVALRLPQAVYLHAASAELSDLRLFDRQGNKLAFALRQPPAQAQTSVRQWPAKIFPVMGAEATDAADAAGLDIRTGGDGRLLSVTPRAAGGARGQDGLRSLILDVGNGGPAPMVSALRFQAPAGVGNYNAQVWLEVSDDFQHWDAVGAAALNWLLNGDTQTLANDKIEFEARPFRYARLSWKEGKPLLFAGVQAELLSQTALAAQTEQLLLQAASTGAIGTDLVYNAAIAIPVEKIGLQFSEPNVVLPSLLGQYQELPGSQIGQPSTHSFQALARTTFYQITQAGQTRGSGDLPIATVHAAQWVLRPLLATQSKPALRLVWSPASVIFLANGNAPYTLAFGRAHAENAAQDLAQVAPGFNPSELLALEQAKAGALQVSQAAPAATGISDAAAAASAAHLRLAVLWGVLLLGVGVLGFFAWRLIKQREPEA